MTKVLILLHVLGISTTCIAQLQSPLPVPSLKPTAKQYFVFHTYGNGHNVSSLRGYWKDVSIIQRPEDDSLVSATYVATEDSSTIDAAEAIMYKCKAKNTACHYFNTLPVVQMCALINAPNMIWSPMTSRIEPRWGCPLNKGTYKMRNATLDMAQLGVLRLPTDAYWSIDINILQSKTVVHATHFEASICNKKTKS